MNGHCSRSIWLAKKSWPKRISAGSLQHATHPRSLLGAQYRLQIYCCCCGCCCCLRASLARSNTCVDRAHLKDNEAEFFFDLKQTRNEQLCCHSSALRALAHARERERERAKRELNER